MWETGLDDPPWGNWQPSRLWICLSRFESWWRSLREMARLECVPREVHLTAEGYSIADVHRTSAWRWTAFVEVDSAGEFVLLYVGRSNAFVIPTRAFERSQLEQLRGFLAERFGAQSVPQTPLA